MERGSSNALQAANQQLHEAEQLRQQRKLTRAQAICEALVNRHPDYVAALCTLGLICGDKGNSRRRWCTSAAPPCTIRSAGPHCWRLGTLFAAGRHGNGGTNPQQARLVNPQNPHILTMLGKAYARAREFELARNTLRQALTLDAGLHVAAIELGICYSQLGQYVEAAEVFENLLKRGVRSLELLLTLNQLPPSVVRIDVLDQLHKLAPDQDADKAEFENSAAFIRATALDRLGRHAEAWDILVPANRKVFQHKQEELAELAERRRGCIAQLRQNPIQTKAMAKERFRFSLSERRGPASQPSNGW
jgi:tetratricopeptide (TPR) repeat protein